MTTRIAGIPDAEFCFGRDELCDILVRSALESGTVLFFGCRQAGKSTVLLRLSKRLTDAAMTDEATQLVIPVYMDLQRLSAEADSSECFRAMVTEAANTCGKLGIQTIDTLATSASAVYVLDHLVSSLAELRKRLQRSDATFLFLFDESKRVLGKRFPRGFQDNLFAFVYGQHQLSGCVSIIFAGAQELYDFSIDETSPIGSRAATCLLTNLDLDAVNSIAAAMGFDDEEAQRFSQRIFLLAGGQAGLSCRILGDAATTKGVLDGEGLIELRQTHSALFQIWNAALSDEARCIQDLLVERQQVSFKDILSSLSVAGLDRYKADRVADELVFSGLARRLPFGLAIANQLYASFVQAHMAPDEENPQVESAWSKIERTELLLRTIVRKAYGAKWNMQADAKMESVIGTLSWQKIQANKAKSARSYRYSLHTPDDDILHYAYLGQLIELMLSNLVWSDFRSSFRDKRELEDISRDVSAVRNDSAHFRLIPERELFRCALRCEDLMHLLRKAEV